MGGFKTFYYDKKGKYILFFGFYAIFFIVLAILFRVARAEAPKDTPKEETKVVTTYNISSLINSDYRYSIEINDNDEIINYNGTKSNIDYANYPNKYFLDIYNINQLLKRSKLVNSDNLVLSYELLNSELNDVLLTDKQEGINTIRVYVNENEEINSIYFDLANYLDKDKYEIMINYIVGENDENSSS